LTKREFFNSHACSQQLFGMREEFLRSLNDHTLKWKLFLRVLFFISRYRQIASYQGQPVAAMLERRKVLLDPVDSASRVFLALVSALELAR
jgi:hypothetical protein